MKKRILGITVLLAVVVLGIAFTACQDTEERICDFYSLVMDAKITVTCAGSKPNSFTLEKATATGKSGPVTVTRTGKDIEVTNITVEGFEGYSAANLIEYQGAVKAGSVTFVVKPQNGVLFYKIDTIPLDD